eukprot:2266677-Rhodomonas_salina.12
MCYDQVGTNPRDIEPYDTYEEQAQWVVAPCMVLCERYAMPGTESGYAATRCRSVPTSGSAAMRLRVAAYPRWH